MKNKLLNKEHVELMGELCGKINHHLMNTFDYKTEPAYVGNFGKVIVARRKKFDLYIRVTEEVSEHWKGYSIVIARIGFEKTRKGSGTTLLKLLTEFALEKSYDVIAIERGVSPSIKKFASKHGFKEIDDCDNYTTTTDDLAEKLEIIKNPS